MFIVRKIRFISVSLEECPGYVVESLDEHCFQDVLIAREIRSHLVHHVENAKTRLCSAALGREVLSLDGIPTVSFRYFGGIEILVSDRR